MGLIAMQRDLARNQGEKKNNTTTKSEIETAGAAKSLKIARKLKHGNRGDEETKIAINASDPTADTDTVSEVSVSKGQSRLLIMRYA